jgi:hypothetical protein
LGDAKIEDDKKRWKRGAGTIYKLDLTPDSPLLVKEKGKREEAEEIFV